MSSVLLSDSTPSATNPEAIDMRLTASDVEVLKNNTKRVALRQFETFVENVQHSDPGSLVDISEEGVMKIAGLCKGVFAAIDTLLPGEALTVDILRKKLGQIESQPEVQTRLVSVSEKLREEFQKTVLQPLHTAISGLSDLDRVINFISDSDGTVKPPTPDLPSMQILLFEGRLSHGVDDGKPLTDSEKQKINHWTLNWKTKDVHDDHRVGELRLKLCRVLKGGFPYRTKNDDIKNYILDLLEERRVAPPKTTSKAAMAVPPITADVVEVRIDPVPPKAAPAKPAAPKTPVQQEAPQFTPKVWKEIFTEMHYFKSDILDATRDGINRANHKEIDNYFARLADEIGRTLFAKNIVMNAADLRLAIWCYFEELYLIENGVQMTRKHMGRSADVRAGILLKALRENVYGTDQPLRQSQLVHILRQRLMKTDKEKRVLNFFDHAQERMENIFSIRQTLQAKTATPKPPVTKAPPVKLPPLRPLAPETETVIPQANKDVIVLPEEPLSDPIVENQTPAPPVEIILDLPEKAVQTEAPAAPVPQMLPTEEVASVPDVVPQAPITEPAAAEHAEAALQEQLAILRRNIVRKYAQQYTSLHPDESLTNLENDFTVLQDKYAALLPIAQECGEKLQQYWIDATFAKAEGINSVDDQKFVSEYLQYAEQAAAHKETLKEYDGTMFELRKTLETIEHFYNKARQFFAVPSELFAGTQLEVILGPENAHLLNPPLNGTSQKVMQLEELQSQVGELSQRCADSLKLGEDIEEHFDEVCSVLARKLAKGQKSPEEQHPLPAPAEPRNGEIIKEVKLPTAPAPAPVKVSKISVNGKAEKREVEVTDTQLRALMIIATACGGDPKRNSLWGRGINKILEMWTVAFPGEPVPDKEQLRAHLERHIYDCGDISPGDLGNYRHLPFMALTFRNNGSAHAKATQLYLPSFAGFDVLNAAAGTDEHKSLFAEPVQRIMQSIAKQESASGTATKKKVRK